MKNTKPVFPLRVRPRDEFGHVIESTTWEEYCEPKTANGHSAVPWYFAWLGA